MIKGNLCHLNEVFGRRRGRLRTAPGRSVPRSVDSPVAELRELTGGGDEFHVRPRRAGDMPKSRALVEKARELLGYEPLVQASEGLRRTLEWYEQRMALSK